MTAPAPAPKPYYYGSPLVTSSAYAYSPAASYVYPSVYSYPYSLGYSSYGKWNFHSKVLPNCVQIHVC